MFSIHNSNRLFNFCFCKRLSFFFFFFPERQYWTKKNQHDWEQDSPRRRSELLVIFHVGWKNKSRSKKKIIIKLEILISSQPFSTWTKHTLVWITLREKGCLWNTKKRLPWTNDCHRLTTRRSVCAGTVPLTENDKESQPAGWKTDRQLLCSKDQELLLWSLWFISFISLSFSNL